MRCIQLEGGICSHNLVPFLVLLSSVFIPTITYFPVQWLSFRTCHCFIAVPAEDLWWPSLWISAGSLPILWERASAQPDAFGFLGWVEREGLTFDSRSFELSNPTLLHSDDHWSLHSMFLQFLINSRLNFRLFAQKLAFFLKFFANVPWGEWATSFLVTIKFFKV